MAGVVVGNGLDDVNGCSKSMDWELFEKTVAGGLGDKAADVWVGFFTASAARDTVLVEREKRLAAIACASEVVASTCSGGVVDDGPVRSEVSVGSSASSGRAARRARYRMKMAARSAATGELLERSAVGSDCSSSLGSLLAISSATGEELAAVDRKEHRVSTLGAGFCYLRAVSADSMDSVRAAVGGFPSVGKLAALPVQVFEPLSVLAALHVSVEGTVGHLLPVGIRGGTRFLTLVRSLIGVWDPGTLGALVHSSCGSAQATFVNGEFVLGAKHDTSELARVGFPEEDDGCRGMTAAAGACWLKAVSVGCREQAMRAVGFWPTVGELLRTPGDWYDELCAGRIAGLTVTLCPGGVYRVGRNPAGVSFLGCMVYWASDGGYGPRTFGGVIDVSFEVSALLTTNVGVPSVDTRLGIGLRAVDRLLRVSGLSWDRIRDFRGFAIDGDWGHVRDYGLMSTDVVKWDLSSDLVNIAFGVSGGVFDEGCSPRFSVACLQMPLPDSSGFLLLKKPEGTVLRVADEVCDGDGEWLLMRPGDSFAVDKCGAISSFELEFLYTHLDRRTAMEMADTSDMEIPKGCIMMCMDQEDKPLVEKLYAGRADAIRVLTVHESIGRTFDHVWLHRFDDCLRNRLSLSFDNEALVHVAVSRHKKTFLYRSPGFQDDLVSKWIARADLMRSDWSGSVDDDDDGSTW